MKDNLNDYATLGLVHHMLYSSALTDAETHVKTLLDVSEMEEFATFDCFVPYGDVHRRTLIRNIARTRKEIVYALHAFPLRKIALASASLTEQGISRLIVRDQIEMAAAIGATGFIFASGPDFPDDRTDAKKRLLAFAAWFCNELAPYGMTALLEPFDRSIDKKFLLGPTEECVAFIQSLHGLGIRNIAIELDMAHVPLMGETFGHAIRTAAPYLQRVHLGNCILKDPSHEWYGDYHPPIGFAGGEIDTQELAVILQELLSVGYLNKQNKGALVLEMVPWPNQAERYTIHDNLQRLYDAWRLI